MTYTVDLDYKTERIDYVFTYNAKEQREFDMADNVVAFTVSYRTFSHPLKSQKTFCNVFVYVYCRTIWTV